MAVNVDNQSNNDSNATTYTTYRSRWLMLALFSLLNMSNALLWVTFTPISNLTSIYLGSTGSVTAVNMLAVVFQILYPFGTIFGVLVMKRYQLRGTIMYGSVLTCIGAFIRLIGTLIVNDNDGARYACIFIGQCLASIAQPFFVNIPPSISSSWFPVEERDIATTIGSLCSPFGNAIGQILPVLFVTKHTDSTTGTVTIDGMNSLMAIEFAINFFFCVLAYFFFQSSPPTPPSHSVKLRDDIVDRGSTRVSSMYNNNIDIYWRKAKIEFYELFNNRDYVYLLITFSMGLGIFNSFINLINQIVAPQGYSNDDAGLFGLVLIISGLVGAGAIGFLLERTHAYRTTLKVGFTLCLLAMILFALMLKPSNFYGLMVSFVILGLCILPMLPTVLENCSECTYPINEDLPVGLLFIGGNLLSIAFTFVLQPLVHDKKYTDNPPLLPSNLFLIIILFIAVIVCMCYNGKYRRLECELRKPLLSNSGLNADKYDNENIARVGSINSNSNSVWMSEQNSNSVAHKSDYSLSSAASINNKQISILSSAVYSNAF